MQVFFEAKRKYEGKLKDMPLWARNIVVPWYKRILTNNFFMYFVVLVGLGCYFREVSPYCYLNIPTVILLMEMCRQVSYDVFKHKYLQFQQGVKEVETPEKKGIIKSPFYQNRK